MPTKNTIPYNKGIFSITFTCIDWIPIIEITQGYNIIYQWFDFSKSRGHFISGYVILPNHIHVLIGFRRTDQVINNIIGNGKRLIPYPLIKRLKAHQNLILLEYLSNSVTYTKRKVNKQHNIWNLSFDWKHCKTEKFILQKLNYYHNNPCKGKWTLCNSQAEYIHSSGKFYITGEQGVYPILSFRELIDYDLD
jgi:hypothetical protein